MHRIDGAGHINNLFVHEDPNINRPPTEVTAIWLNACQEEISKLVEATGIVLDKVDNSQLLKALSRVAVEQKFTSFVTGGTGSAFMLTPNPAITAYAAGQRFRVAFHADGAGSSTIDVNGLGAKNIKQYDKDGTKVAPIIKANHRADLEYDGTDFVLVNSLPGVDLEEHLNASNPHTQYLKSSEFPFGSVIPFAGMVLPPGFLEANGASLSTAAYPELYAAIGNTHGGDGNTFYLPNAQRRVIRGAGSGLSVGTTQNHAIQNITGAFRITDDVISNPWPAVNHTGAFYGLDCGYQGISNAGYGGAGTVCTTTGFDASRVVSTADETRVDGIILLQIIRAYKT
uniref:Phage Tail Collar Domain n=1 Tax=Candidatus Kentrum sp. LFY TaxID=2126342 RepID=A0A450UE94_9GAMM|nr:MAG: Phage Tail Collar Domain [Candidatus Kentron sp. LFY]